jgi:hypothetical protein
VRLRGVVAIVAVIMLATTMGYSRAGSVDRSKGDFWTYDMSTTITVMGLKLNVSGSISYLYKGQSMVSVGENVHPANDLSVEGSLEGPVLLMGKGLGSVEVLLTGTQYELSGSIGMLKENLTSTTDVTIQAGFVSFAYQVETQTIVTTDPPVLAEFDPEGTRLGETWTQAVTVNSTVISWEDGTVANTTTQSAGLTYSASVALSRESLSTPAGIFDAMRIVASDSSGNYDIFWWASEVNNFVKHEAYGNESATPILTLELSDFGRKSPAFPITFIVLGGAVLLVAVAVLVLVLLISRRPKTPVTSPGRTAISVDKEPADPNIGQGNRLYAPEEA